LPTVPLLALALVACGGGGFGEGTPPPPSSIAIEEAFPDLPDIGSPLYFAQAPGDSTRSFVVSKQGVIRVFAHSPTVNTSTVFLNIQGRVDDEDEQGLLGLAFDPGYQTNRHFYVHYNPAGGTRRSRISRFTANTDFNSADVDSETIVLSLDQPVSRTNHKGGWIGFGPDGKLYIATGDGGGTGDPDNNAQNRNSPLGKILRINSDGTVPADNPFFGQVGRRAEVWAYGLRNPYRASFDRANGAFWVADVGQDRREEINLVTRGGNYGWRKYEGSLVYDSGDPIPDGAVAPLFEYNNAGNRCSVTGGYVYRGAALDDLTGAYVFGDFCSGEVWALTRDGDRVTSTAIGDVGSQLTSFGEDNAGEVYMTSFDGRIYKLVPAD
jgi:glucose/arabinose dehydrogenase